MRRSGRTTRIIDNIIQDLFIKGQAEIKDHDDFGYANIMNLKGRVLHRLESEHSIKKEDVFYTGSDEGKVLINIIKV